jgi:receptor protein-tyrosine kinase
LAAKNLLSELRTQFDYVIVDSSPLVAVTDAAILAADSDGVLIMARHGQTKREQLAQAVGNLTDVGAPLVGAVLTLTPERGQGVYNYGYYGDAGPERTSRESFDEPAALPASSTDAALHSTEATQSAADVEQLKDRPAQHRTSRIAPPA